VAPKFAVPPGPFGAPCPLTSGLRDEWIDLAEQALKLGFPLPF
jgi:hypothetical protein